MMSAIKRRSRAAEYRVLAEKSADLAAASSLDHVREKHETAALRWSVLAAADERPRSPNGAIRVGAVVNGQREP